MFEDLITEEEKEEEFLHECPVCGAGFDGFVCPFCFFQNPEPEEPRWKFDLYLECKECPVKGIWCDRCV